MHDSKVMQKPCNQRQIEVSVMFETKKMINENSWMDIKSDLIES